MSSPEKRVVRPAPDEEAIAEAARALLAAIAAEPVPDRLRKLAIALETALDASQRPDQPD
jgi:hypothetical protein